MFDFVWIGDYDFCIRNNYWNTFIKGNAVSNSIYYLSTNPSCTSYERWTIEVLAVPLYVDISYTTDVAATTELEPLTVATQILDNRNSTIDQSMTFEFSKAISHSNTFTHEHGFTVGLAVEVKANIPFIGSSKVTVSGETSHNWSYGN